MKNVIFILVAFVLTAALSFFLFEEKGKDKKGEIQVISIDIPVYYSHELGGIKELENSNENTNQKTKLVIENKQGTWQSRKDYLKECFHKLRNEDNSANIENLLREISEMDSELNYVFANIDKLSLQRQVEITEEISRSRHISDKVKKEFSRLSLTTFANIIDHLGESKDLSFSQKLRLAEGILYDLVEIAQELQFTQNEIDAFAAEGILDSPYPDISELLIYQLSEDRPNIKAQIDALRENESI